MSLTKKYTCKKWEVSCIKLEFIEGYIYKITRRIPELHVAETKIFHSERKAMLQLQRWLE